MNGGKHGVKIAVAALYALVFAAFAAVTIVTAGMKSVTESDGRVWIAFAFTFVAVVLCVGSTLMRTRGEDGVLLRLPSVIYTHVYCVLCMALGFVTVCGEMIKKKIPDWAAKLPYIDRLSKFTTVNILLAIYITLTVVTVVVLAIEYFVNRGIIGGEKKFREEKRTFYELIACAEDLRERAESDGERAALEKLIETFRYSPIYGNADTAEAEVEIAAKLVKLVEEKGDMTPALKELTILVERRNRLLKISQ